MRLTAAAQASQGLRNAQEPAARRRGRRRRARAQVSVELGNGYADVVAAADVALYGGLCALASLERPEFRASVVENVAFREYLDAHPEARAHAVLAMHQQAARGCAADSQLRRPGSCRASLSMLGFFFVSLLALSCMHTCTCLLHT